MRAMTMMLAIGWMSVNLCAQEPTKEPTLRENANVDETQLSEKQINERPMSFWMEKKLNYSSEILRGLASENYDKIIDNGTRMLLLNRVEGFVRRRNPEYRTNLHTFERLTAEVVEQAEKKNIDGATLAFNQLTVSCVRCHQSLRKHESSVGQAVEEELTEDKP